VPEMIALMRLMARPRHAAGSGGVYFDVSSW
jgi:hypothetical protein